MWELTLAGTEVIAITLLVLLQGQYSHSTRHAKVKSVTAGNKRSHFPFHSLNTVFESYAWNTQITTSCAHRLHHHYLHHHYTHSLISLFNFSPYWQILQQATPWKFLADSFSLYFTGLSLYPSSSLSFFHFITSFILSPSIMDHIIRVQ